jgi:hypothetical protein
MASSMQFASAFIHGFVALESEPVRLPRKAAKPPPVLVNNSAFDPNYKLVPCPHFNCVIDIDIDPDDPRAMEKWIVHVVCHWIGTLFRFPTVFHFACFEHEIHGHPVTDGIFRYGISYIAPNWERMRLHYLLLHGYDDNSASEFADLHAYNGDYRNFWCQWCIEFKRRPIGESIDYIYAHYRNHILE